MSWFESLTKEKFQSVVREAVKEELKTLNIEVNELKRQMLALTQAIEILKNEIENIRQRLTRLEEKVDRIQETQVHFATKVGHLEGTIEGTLRGIMADFKMEFYEKFRGELPAKTTRSKAVTRKKGNKSFA